MTKSLSTWLDRSLSTWLDISILLARQISIPLGSTDLNPTSDTRKYAGTQGSSEGQGHTHVKSSDFGRKHQDGSGNWAIAIRTKNDHNLRP